MPLAAAAARVMDGSRVFSSGAGRLARATGANLHVSAGSVTYGPGALAFAGATYDPTSHYRAAAVFQFHAQQGLTAERLREISRRQVSLLKSGVESLDLHEGVAHVEPVPEERRGGFLAIRSPHAGRALARAA